MRPTNHLPADVTLAALRVESVQSVAGREPDILAVEGHAMHILRAGKGAILTNNFGCGTFHGLHLRCFDERNLIIRQRGRE